MTQIKNRKVLVTGAGGFIGNRLVRFLTQQGFWVRGVDLKPPPYETSSAQEFALLDLRRREDALKAVEEIGEVYALAADLGGMGFISSNHSQIFHNNALINIHTMEAARQAKVTKYFYASSACVYPESRQAAPDLIALKEEEAYPAQPQDAYGWEKLMAEKLCHYYGVEHGIKTYIARFHNIFGPRTTWNGGREKAPAALCRKVAVAKQTGNPEIEIWGDGEQTRSFCYIDDCIEGIYRLMNSDYHEPVNLGQNRMVTINQLADMIARIAGIEIIKKNVPGPQGVRGRNSDNTRANQILEWEPKVSLEEGLARTYQWIEEQVQRETAGVVSYGQKR